MIEDLFRRFAKGKDFLDLGILLMVFSSVPLQSLFFSLFHQSLRKVAGIHYEKPDKYDVPTSQADTRAHGQSHRVSNHRCSKMERPPSLNATNKLRAATSTTTLVFITNWESSRLSRRRVASCTPKQQPNLGVHTGRAARRARSTRAEPQHCASTSAHTPRSGGDSTDGGWKLHLESFTWKCL